MNVSSVVQICQRACEEDTSLSTAEAQRSGQHSNPRDKVASWNCRCNQVTGPETSDAVLAHNSFSLLTEKVTMKAAVNGISFSRHGLEQTRIRCRGVRNSSEMAALHKRPNTVPVVDRIGLGIVKQLKLV